MAIWGSSFVVTTLVLDEAGPFAVTLLRFGLGLLVLLPFAYRRGFRFRLALEPASRASPWSTGCRPGRWSSPRRRTPR
jgi:drug/metabolite transporter (DMT)-like permease